MSRYIDLKLIVAIIGIQLMKSLLLQNYFRTVARDLIISNLEQSCKINEKFIVCLHKHFK